MRGLLQPGDSAIDVGGHIGFFTMQMADAVGPRGTRLRVRAARRERRSARTIDRRERLRRSRALSARRGRRGGRHGDADVSGRDAELRRRVSAAARRRAARRQPEAGRAAGRARRARAARGRCASIKMDVEGAEPQVLRGAARMLARRQAGDPLRAAPDPAGARVGTSPPTQFLDADRRARLSRPSARARRRRRAARARARRDALVSVVLMPAS